MTVPRAPSPLPRAPHICRACALPLVQPQSATPEGRGFRVVLRCPSCGWIAAQVLDLRELDRLEEELDKGMAELSVAVEQVTRINMRSYANRFMTALEEDALLPEDF